MWSRRILYLILEPCTNPILAIIILKFWSFVGKASFLRSRVDRFEFVVAGMLTGSAKVGVALVDGAASEIYNWKTDSSSMETLCSEKWHMWEWNLIFWSPSPYIRPGRPPLVPIWTNDATCFVAIISLSCTVFMMCLEASMGVTFMF